jgi:hypothetical protein
MNIICDDCKKSKHHSVIKHTYTNAGEKIKLCMMCCGESEDEEISMLHHSLDEEERNDVIEKNYDRLWEDRYDYYYDER